MFVCKFQLTADSDARPVHDFAHGADLVDTVQIGETVPGHDTPELGSQCGAHCPLAVCSGPQDEHAQVTEHEQEPSVEGKNAHEVHFDAGLAMLQWYAPTLGAHGALCPGPQRMQGD